LAPELGEKSITITTNVRENENILPEPKYYFDGILY